MRQYCFVRLLDPCNQQECKSRTDGSTLWHIFYAVHVAAFCGTHMKLCSHNTASAVPLCWLQVCIWVVLAGAYSPEIPSSTLSCPLLMEHVVSVAQNQWLIYATFSPGLKQPIKSRRQNGNVTFSKGKKKPPIFAGEGSRTFFSRVPDSSLSHSVDNSFSHFSSTSKPSIQSTGRSGAFQIH